MTQAHNERGGKMNKKTVKIIFVTIIPIFLNMLFIFKALAIEGERVGGTWFDYDGSRHECPPDCGGSSSSSSSDSDSGAYQAGQRLGQGIRHALGLDYEERAAEQRQQAQSHYNAGVSYQKNGDWDNAIACHEKAVALDPGNAVFRDNLNYARSRKANILGLAAYNNQKWEVAVRYFQEAMNCRPNDVDKENLRQAQEYLEKERAEAIHNKQLAEAGTKINSILDNLFTDFEGASSGGKVKSDSGLNFMTASGQKTGDAQKSGGLELMGPNEPLYSKGGNDSAMVDLSGEKFLVEPDKIDGIVKESGLKIKDVPLPAAADPYFNKPRTNIILDALEKGRIYGKNKPSDLDVSVKYVNDYLLTRDPRNAHAREALSYLEGMRECASLDTPTLEEIIDHDIKGPKKSPGQQWKGEPNPEAEPQGLKLPENVPIADYVPNVGDSEQLLEAVSQKKVSQTPNEILKQWREERTSAVYYALREGKGDVNQAIEFLENKINKDPAFLSDSPARSALNYLHGYQGYKDYEENSKNKRKGEK
jgi:tetratricopeptide (TPR) repeat protein